MPWILRSRKLDLRHIKATSRRRTSVCFSLSSLAHILR